MKRMKISILAVILIILATFSIGIAAEAVLIKNEQKYVQNDTSQQSLLFDAEITFYIYEGEGCACKPIEGASIYAGGEPGESGVTDDDGKCILTLEPLMEYRVSIEAEDFHMVLFDFDVIDDQTFTFHMQEKDDSSLHESSILHRLVKNLLER